MNEWSGLGNHNTAEFWEYDTRTGRRLELDPIDQIDISNYAINALNPIWFTDPLGDKNDKDVKNNPNAPCAKGGTEKFHKTQTQSSMGQTQIQVVNAQQLTPFTKDLLNHAVKSEGGYVDNKADPGGKTKYGIAETREWPQFARFHNMSTDPDNIKNITQKQAEDYYRDKNRPI